MKPVSKIERHLLTPPLRLHPLRAFDLTASDIGAVAGYGPYRSALAVYAEKTGMLPGQDESAPMRRGRWLEAAIGSALRERYPTWRIEPANMYLRDPEIRLGATPDFIAEDPEQPHVLVNIQGKVVSPGVFEREWGEDGSPIGYQLQTLCEGMLMGAGRNLLAALVVDTYSAELEVREIPRHAGAEERLRQVAIDFWENVRSGRRPVPDYDRDAEILAAMYPPRPEDDPIDLTGDNRLPILLEDRARLNEAAGATKKLLERNRAEIVDKLQGAPVAICGPWKVKWKEEAVKEYTVAASTRQRLYVSGGPKGEDDARDQ